MDAGRWNNNNGYWFITRARTKGWIDDLTLEQLENKSRATFADSLCSICKRGRTSSRPKLGNNNGSACRADKTARTKRESLVVEILLYIPCYSTLIPIITTESIVEMLLFPMSLIWRTSLSFDFSLPFFLFFFALLSSFSSSCYLPSSLPPLSLTITFQNLEYLPQSSTQFGFSLSLSTESWKCFSSAYYFILDDILFKSFFSWLFFCSLWLFLDFDILAEALPELFKVRLNSRLVSALLFFVSCFASSRIWNSSTLLSDIDIQSDLPT